MYHAMSKKPLDLDGLGVFSLKSDGGLDTLHFDEFFCVRHARPGSSSREPSLNTTLKAPIL